MGMAAGLEGVMVAGRWVAVAVVGAMMEASAAWLAAAAGTGLAGPGQRTPNPRGELVARHRLCVEASELRVDLTDMPKVE